MTKLDLIDKVSTKLLERDYFSGNTSLAKRKEMIRKCSRTAVDVFFDSISRAIESKQGVEIRGLGCFAVKSSQDRKFVVPHNKSVRIINKLFYYNFVMGKELRERLNSVSD